MGRLYCSRRKGPRFGDDSRAAFGPGEPSSGATKDGAQMMLLFAASVLCFTAIIVALLCYRSRQRLGSCDLVQQLQSLDVDAFLNLVHREDHAFLRKRLSPW